MPQLVLVVEDDPDVAGLMRMILQDGGYAVRSASTLAEAEEALRGGPLPALIVLDLVLPDGDGLALCSIARGRVPPLPVTVVTARAEPAARAAALAAGCSGVVVKPFEPDALLGVVRAAIGPP